MLSLHWFLAITYVAIEYRPCHMSDNMASLPLPMAMAVLLLLPGAPPIFHIGSIGAGEEGGWGGGGGRRRR